MIFSRVNLGFRGFMGYFGNFWVQMKMEQNVHSLKKELMLGLKEREAFLYKHKFGRLLFPSSFFTFLVFRIILGFLRILGNFRKRSVIFMNIRLAKPRLFFLLFLTYPSI